MLRTAFCWMAVGLLMLAWMPVSVEAQQQPTSPATLSPTNRTATVAPKLPAPAEITLPTRDGLVLDATFYGSTKGREAVPVVLLHMYKGNRTDYADLALFLQSLGHAVIVPDLRGHGTTKKKNSDAGADGANPTPDFFLAMVTYDMEAIQKFLVTKNNAGELNIEKLCVVGAEMGATIAVNWAGYDWSQPELLTGKQGQDVKALVLLSPKFVFRGLSLKQAVAANASVRRDLSILILVGKGKTDATEEAERVYAYFKPFHPDPPENQKEEEQDLFFGKLDTTLEGTQILAVKGSNAHALIAQFIKLRVEGQSLPWQERKVF